RTSLPTFYHYEILASVRQIISCTINRKSSTNNINSYGFERPILLRTATGWQLPLTVKVKQHMAV
ncbi:hypothetical protein, partial [Nitrososphaera sp. AFS]|uniref:hypothetical protein n=1 Tax=Nitrososphaera sp. AFS TaxID=2301191 RepID=UPI001F29778E